MSSERHGCTTGYRARLPVSIRHIAMAALAALVTATCSQAADKVVMNVVAANPLDQPMVVNVRAEFPRGATTNDVLDAGGLDIGYDAASNVYFLHKEVNVASRESVRFAVRFKDAWIIPEAEMAALAAEAAAVAERMKGGKSAPLAARMNQSAQSAIAAVRERQKLATAERIGAAEHMAAYDNNRNALAQTRVLVGQLEALAASEGVGTAGRNDGLARRVSVTPCADRPDCVKLTLSLGNTTDRDESISFAKLDLPQELKREDVLDTAGLDCRWDAAQGICSVTKANLNLNAGETVQFVLIVRDKWNATATRAREMKPRVEAAAAAATGEDARKVIEALATEVDAIAEVRPSEDGSTDYVALCRRHATRLNEIEQQLSVSQPRGRTGPGMWTTALPIVVLVLAVAAVAVVLFVRSRSS